MTKAETVGVKNGVYDGGTAATTYGYEANGNLSWVKDPLDHQTSYVYDTWFQAYQVCATNAAGHTAKLFYYGVPGGVAVIPRAARRPSPATGSARWKRRWTPTACRRPTVTMTWRVTSVLLPPDTAATQVY